MSSTAEPSLQPPLCRHLNVTGRIYTTSLNFNYFLGSFSLLPKGSPFSSLHLKMATEAGCGGTHLYLSTWEAEAVGPIEWAAWPIEWVPGQPRLHREIQLSQEKKKANWNFLCDKTIRERILEQALCPLFLCSLISWILWRVLGDLYFRWHIQFYGFTIWYLRVRGSWSLSFALTV